tara:strand:+ start:8164 stop:8511 length:348 start_codon:yes stop_codon:yes gene_type:complete
MGFKMGKESRGMKNSSNVKIVRRDLDGIYGEAHDNGEVHIDKDVKPGSALDKSVIRHETQHVNDMRSGKLSYGDDYLRWSGKTYPRKNGKIKYNGKWLEEGSKSFPWEKVAYAKN